MHDTAMDLVDVLENQAGMAQDPNTTVGDH